MSDQQLQLEIESLFNKNQTVPRIIQEFEANGFRDNIEYYEIPVDFGLTLLAQMCLHKRASLPTLVGLLRYHFTDAANPSQECVDMLLKALQAGLLNWEPAREEFVLAYDISSDVQDDINNYQYPLPMVIPPLEVTDNTQTGYLTIKNSLILKDNHHDDDICLDHINRVNQVKLRLNMVVAEHVHNTWKGLDKKQAGEDTETFERRKRSFEKYMKTSKATMQLLEISGNEFYLTHKYDKRGRCYCQGYHVNYQGNPWNKAVIEFAQGEVTK